MIFLTKMLLVLKKTAVTKALKALEATIRKEVVSR